MHMYMANEVFISVRYLIFFKLFGLVVSTTDNERRTQSGIRLIIYVLT